MKSVILVLPSTSLCLGIPGCFLMLRRLSMATDAINHAVSPGIALGFFFVWNSNSPVLIVSAALFGLSSILLTGQIILRCNVARDEALGLVSPVFFALGVILVTRCFRNVHLDTELTLMGNPSFVSFLQNFGLPRAVLFNLLLFTTNLALAGLRFRSFCYTCFDLSHTALLGLPLQRIFYAPLTLGTFNAVIALQGVGAVLSIVSFATVVATASLLARSLDGMLLLTLAIGAVVAMFGSVATLRINASPSGTYAALFPFTLLPLCLSALLRSHQHDTDNQKDGAE